MSADQARIGANITETGVQKGWRACLGRLQCFASRKRERPATQLTPGPAPSDVDNGSALSDGAASLSPLIHAPPSSPASFPYSDNLPSPAALLTLFPLKSAGHLCGGSGPQTDSVLTNAAARQPFSLDCVLVTPPVYSTLTTEPTTPLSTAPFTPPPELAHLTQPPSPEVPFAELVASSLSLKCTEHNFEQKNKVSGPSNLKLAYQLYSGSPIAAGELVSPESRASSSENASPLPERAPFLEDGASPPVIASSTTLLQPTSSFGLNHAISADAHGHHSPELVYQHRNEHAQTENVVLEKELDADCSCPVSNEAAEQGSVALTCENQRRQVESAGMNTEIPSKAPKDLCIQRIQQGTKNLTNREQLDSNSTGQPEEQKQEAGFNMAYYSITGTECFVEGDLNETQDAGKCSTCGVLTSKCKALSEALHQTKEKLSLIEKKENLIDDREKKFKQLIEWMQLEAKSQEASIFRLSEELSWQEAAYFDLHGQHLAELGIELPVGRELSSTEVL